MLMEVRWHGRGGQGVVSVSRLLAYAALFDGKHVQAFPEFGPERAGAPVSGFTRIGDETIDIHSQIYNPDVVVVIDPTLLRTVNVAEGLTEGGAIIVNTKKTCEELRKELGIKEDIHVYTVNAARIALDILRRPIYNTAMLGALIKVVPLVTLESVIKAVMERFPGGLGEKNVEAIKRAYEEVEGNER